MPTPIWRQALNARALNFRISAEKMGLDCAVLIFAKKWRKRNALSCKF